jgi:alpha-pyrone synthase
MAAYLNHIACAVPPHERQRVFIESLPLWAGSSDVVAKLKEIVANSHIDQRFTVLPAPFDTPSERGYYRVGAFPSTGERMKTYQREAPRLAVTTLDLLRRDAGSLAGVTHLIVTSCTGFYAPGLDVDIVRECGLSSKVQRTLIGFMGCHAALVGMRSAKQIIESDPEAMVLMVNLELCSLHLQQTDRMDRLVSFLLFSDGCAASLITARPEGLRLDSSTSHLSLADSERMAWHIEDSGFAMTLDARLPARIRQWFRSSEELSQPGGAKLWAIHPGGRLILDSVQSVCGLSDEQMSFSRDVLRRYGNMSSASVMFVLRELMRANAEAAGHLPGRAIAFGPGLTVETMDFTAVRARPQPSHLASASELISV